LYQGRDRGDYSLYNLTQNLQNKLSRFKHYLVCTECPKQPFLAVVKTEMSKGWPGVFVELSHQTK